MRWARMSLPRLQSVAYSPHAGPHLVHSVVRLRQGYQSDVTKPPALFVTNPGWPSDVRSGPAMAKPPAAKGL